MGSTGHNRAKESSFESEKSVAESPLSNITGPTFSAEQAQEPELPNTNESPVSSLVEDSLAASSISAAPVTTGRSKSMEPESHVVAERPQDTAMQAASRVSVDRAAVPVVPQDSGSTPGISSGRQVNEGTPVQDSTGYPTVKAPENAIQSNIDGWGYSTGYGYVQQPQVRQVQRADEDEEQEPAEQVDVSTESAGYVRGKQRYLENEGRAAIMEAGEIESPEPLNLLSRANRRFKESEKLIRERITAKLKAKGRVGKTAFQDTIFSLSSVWPDCVSIGSANLEEALRNGDSSIIDRINKADPSFNLDFESCLNDIRILVDAINRSNVEVLFSKSPVNTKGSVQVRTLRAHYGRGIALHPTQTKAYNADFDGDTGNLNLDPSVLKNHSRAMTHLIDAEGNPAIDADFFPLDYMAMPTSRERAELLESMQERNFSWSPDVATKIVDAYIDACNKGDWVGLLRTIDKVAGSKELQAKTRMPRGRLMSRILKNVYDYAIDRRGYNLRLEWASVVDSYEYIEPDPDAHPFVVALIDMVDAIAKGRPAPNFQDFTLFYNKQYGDVGGESVGGKNVPFRLLADFAKSIKRTDLVTIGDYTWGVDENGNFDEDSSVTIYDLWQFTCSAGVSKLISGRVKMGSHELAVSTQVKSKVVEILSEKYNGTPVPAWVDGQDDYNRRLFREWMKDFKKAYNAQMRMLNVSQVSVRAGMGLSRGKNLERYDGFKDFKDPDFAKAFIEIFGDYTMERVFPGAMLGYGRDKADGRENTNEGIIWRYHMMTVSEFAIHNRLDWYSERRGESKLESMNKRFDNGDFKPMDIVMVIADRRSKQFGDYEKSWIEATGKHASIMHRIRDDISKNDFNNYAYDMLELLHMVSPRMFDHFGMDSPITFVRSKWGKKLMDCNSPSEFRSILVSMTIEYRMSRASGLLRSIEELGNETVQADDYRERVEAIDSVYVNELKNIASSSLAWESIISETLGDSNAFRTLLHDKKIVRRGHNYKLDAREFWEKTDPESQYSLINFLKSDADYETKMAVLCDVVKFNTGIESIDVKHIIGMLAHNPDPLFAGSKFEMDSGIRSATDSVKDSIDGLTSYKSKSPSKINQIAGRIIEDALGNKHAFEEKLYRFSTEPGYYVHVDTIFAADAISSIYEKAYSDSEKIKQQSLVNAFFECISLQRSGSFFTHLQQTDNKVVNAVGFDQLTNLDIVRILGDPSIKLNGYDEFGAPCVFSRRSLCGGDTIDDVIDYLTDHPRIALACRRHIVGINADVRGTARLSVLDDADAGLSYTDSVFSLLNDRYRFLAIAALITPTKGDVSRNLSAKVNDNIRNLCLFVLNEAASGKDGLQVTQDIEDFFGVGDSDSLESMIIRLRNEGAFDKLEFGLDDYVAARNLVSDVTEELLDCIDIIRNSGIPLRSVPDKFINRGSIGIDKSSMVAYYDARQQLSGARTFKMIRIEGSETKKNLVLKEFLRNRQDRFMTVSEDTPKPELLKLSDLTKRNLSAEIEASEDGIIVVEVPQGWNVEDLTLEHITSKQIGSIAKFLEIKREKGAETFNAKSKKYGDDGTNSIIKFLKYGSKAMLSRYGKGKDRSIEDGMELRRAIESAGSKNEAIPILAEALMQADRELGYIDVGSTFQKSDYYNRADLMLAQSVDENGNVSIYIRTLEQLAVAFRNRLSDEAMLSKKADVVLAELAQIADVVGTDADPMANPGLAMELFDDVRIISGVGSVGRIDRALRPYSSSTERNYTLMWQLFKAFGQDEFGNAAYEMPSRKEIIEHSNKMFAKLDNASVKDALKGVAYPRDKWIPAHKDEMSGRWVKGRYSQDPNGSREFIYDYLGRPQDDGFTLIPGLQSLVYIDDNEHLDVIEKCKKYGITVAFTDARNIPEKYIADSVVLQGVIILPFFDMRLNGSVADAVPPAPGQFPFQPNNAIIAVENTTYDVRQGDAAANATQEGLDKIHFNLDGTEVFDVFDLFPNILRVGNANFADSVFQLKLCTKEEISRWVLSGQGSVDYGVHETNQHFAREARRYDIRLNEYAEKFDSGLVDDNGFIIGDCRYDSIVGFVKLQIDANTFAFAPIVPFYVGKKAPSNFRVEGFEINDDKSSYSMKWRFTGDVRNQYIKFFEGIGASSKFIVHGGNPIRSRKLANGLPVDIMYSTKSVSSRLFPKNKRIHTLVSMMMVTRIDPAYSYNFGELPGAFPDNPDIAQSLREGYLTRSDWSEIVKNNPKLRYHIDPEINSVVKWLVEKCVKPGTGYQTVNPTILLSTRTQVPIATEFECFMDTGYNFQNALMKLMNAMNPTLVPANIEDSSENTLFKPVKKDSNEEDYGVLQMMVPYWDYKGKPYKMAQNVYISFGFFGDEFSGFKRVNYDAANRGIDDLNVSSSLDGFDLSQVMSFGRSGMSHVPSIMGKMEMSQDNIMEDANDILENESDSLSE